MLRNYCLITACLLLPLAAHGAIWPDEMSGFKRVSLAPAAVPDRALWDEYGLDQAERAEYTSAARNFKATAYRLKDPTGAFAAFESLRPAGAKPLALTAAAADTGAGELFVFGNYVLQFEDWKPKLEDITAFLQRLPNLDQSPLPVRFLPSQGLVANSERYVLGPTSLERYIPGVPPATAAFSMGGEAQVGQYNTAAGPMQMAVFSYPNPQIARQRLEAFQQLPGVMAKRSGILVAAITAPKDANVAEKLLALVQYKATITTNERVPTRKDNVADLMLNIFMLVGIILALIVPAGLAVGLMRRMGWGTSGDPMTVLHLEDQKRSQRP
ncbi:MAG: DUF6599 family protein [Acidobacteriota bacterium]